MKKLLLLSLFTILSAGYTFAQKDVAAKDILNKVSAKYKMYDVVKTDFVFTLDNQQAGVKESQTGTLVAKSKLNKFKVSLYGKDAATKNIAEQEIISDGKTQWTYLKKDNEVQVGNVDNSGGGLNPAKIFTIYEHGYKYIYTGEKKIGGVIYQEIDLTPEDDKTSFFKVRLEIDKAKKQIYSALIFDKNGNKYTYTLKTFVPNVAVADNTFTFDAKAHKGVEVVDLR
ncbi:MAG: outer membrane lipoprotein carrier protein LolA [Bacteroidota bacterium]|nr:outer membrane lipoprotein carrier protein LolA [Bacteroidota bacterium]